MSTIFKVVLVVVFPLQPNIVVQELDFHTSVAFVTRTFDRTRFRHEHHVQGRARERPGEILTREGYFVDTINVRVASR